VLMETNYKLQTCQTHTSSHTTVYNTPKAKRGIKVWGGMLKGFSCDKKLAFPWSMFGKFWWLVWLVPMVFSVRKF
jgi:hypothetical protein